MKCHLKLHIDITLHYIMHPALRKGPLFYKNTPPFSIFLQKTSPISFPAYGPVRGLCAGRHGQARGRRAGVDAEHDYESMDDESAAARPCWTDLPTYPGGPSVGGLARYPARPSVGGYQAVGVETALRRGGNGYSATSVVTTTPPPPVSRHCSFPPTTFN